MIEKENKQTNTQNCKLTFAPLLFSVYFFSYMYQLPFADVNYNLHTPAELSSAPLSLKRRLVGVASIRRFLHFASLVHLLAASHRMYVAHEITALIGVVLVFENVLHHTNQIHALFEHVALLLSVILFQRFRCWMKIPVLNHRSCCNIVGNKTHLYLGSWPRPSRLPLFSSG